MIYPKDIANKPPRPNGPLPRYCYEGFWALHWGTVGDEFWLKLKAKEEKVAARKQKRQVFWARIKNLF